MKTLLLITTIGLLGFTATAQDHNIPKQPKDRTKAAMQQEDQSKASSKKTGKTRKNRNNTDSLHKMENYPSNRQTGGSNREEQQFIDSNINNHR